MGTIRTNAMKKEYIWNKVLEQSKYGLGYLKKKLIAECCIDCETTKRTASEIVKLFIDSERFEEINEVLYIKGTKDAKNG